jgi:hypothetical protein
MASIRTACATGVAVCCVLLLITKHLYSEPLTDKALVESNDKMQDILKDAVAEDGTIVLCKANICRDLETGEQIGRGRDGYYVTFENKPGYQEKLERFQARVKAWLDKK